MDYLKSFNKRFDCRKEEQLSQSVCFSVVAVITDAVPIGPDSAACFSKDRMSTEDEDDEADC